MSPTVATTNTPDGRLTARKAARRPVANLDERGVAETRQIANPPRRRVRSKKVAQGPPPELRTVGIDDFCELIGVSRMTVWRMCRRGDIQSVTVGAKRLILLDSWHRYIERSKGVQGN